MRAFADKLIDILEGHTREVAEQWSRAVRTNPRTPSFHKLDHEQYVHHAAEFYKNLRRLYFAERPYTEDAVFFLRFADDMHRKGIPLHELVYALILMRRHIWLYADFHAVFVTTLDMHQAVESINRTIQMFDHVLFGVVQRYGELSRREPAAGRPAA